MVDKPGIHGSKVQNVKVKQVVHGSNVFNEANNSFVETLFKISTSSNKWSSCCEGSVIGVGQG